MMRTSPFAGFTANWIFEPPVSTPTLRMQRDRHIAQVLIFDVGQSLCRSNRDRIAGVHAHRVEVFDRADDDDVVVQVAHHLELVFLPAEDRFFDQDLRNRRRGQAAPRDLFKFFAGYMRCRRLFRRA